MRMRILAAALLLVSASAHADVSLKTYQDGKALGGVSKSTVETYVTGVARGVFWASALTSNGKAGPIICMPPKLGVDQGMVLGVMDRYIKSERSKGSIDNETPIEYIVLMSLKETFPCP